jgi:hypothetical protein
MNRITVDSRTPAVTQRLIAFVREMEDLDHTTQFWPASLAPRAELVELLRGVVSRQ